MTTIHDHEINEFNSEHISVVVRELAHEYEILVDGQRGEDGVLIKFQNGPVKEVGANGITDEALLAVVLDRLRTFQDGKFRCRENAMTITKLEEALHWLEHRSKARERRGVEGTLKV